MPNCQSVYDKSPLKPLSDAAFTIFIKVMVSVEVALEVEDKEKVLEAVKEKYSDGKQDFMDGVTVEYEDWWFNIRPSQTEPVLRLTMEANTDDILKKKKKELEGIIK